MVFQVFSKCEAKMTHSFISNSKDTLESLYQAYRLAFR